MKKYKGKIIASLILLLVTATLFVRYMTPKAWAASEPAWEAHTFRFLGAYTNPYVILRDEATGYVIDKTTGIAAAGETYADNTIAATRDTSRGWWEASIPAMSKRYVPVMTSGDAASPAYTDTSLFGGYYDAEKHRIIDPQMPNDQGRLLVK